MPTAIPDDWTVARALDRYLAENGFRREDYDAPWVEVETMGMTLPLPNPPQRQRGVRIHDLHHVVTGYGTDLAGEAEISAWELRRGLTGIGWFVRSLVLFGAVAGLFHSPLRTVAAWRASGAGSNLFALSMADGYPSILGQTVGALRRQLGVPPGGLSERHALHDGAPIPSA